MGGLNLTPSNMATSEIKAPIDRYKFVRVSTGSYANLVNGFAVNYNYSAVIPSGYSLLQPIVVNAPNDNWFAAFATKVDATTLKIAGQNLYSGALSGSFTLLLIFEKA